MKIIFFTSDNSKASGAFLSMAKLSEELKNRYKINVKVVLPSVGDGIEILNQTNICYTYIRSYNWIMPMSLSKNFFANIKALIKICLNSISYYRINKFLDREKPDVIHINTTYAYIAALVAYRKKIPVVWHLREFLEEDQGNKIFCRKLGYSVINRATAIVAISKAVYKKYENTFDKERLHLIYNGIDIERFWKPDKQIFQSNKIQFVCVGGLYSGKGHELLIRACEKLVEDKQRAFSLKIVGSGEEEDNLKLLTRELKLEPYIEFCGYSRTPEKYYEEADIAFMTSKSEAFGRVTVEAMLSGALVIGAESAATIELLGDNQYGILYRNGDLDDLVKTIKDVLVNKEQMKIIADHARENAYVTFSSRKNTENIFNLYKKIIG